MNYQIVTNEYWNTGGNCMMQICEVYLADENKTVYCFANEHGCILSTVDYMRKEVEYDDEMLIDRYDLDDADEGQTTDYIELYRDCMNLYVRSEYSRFKTEYALPYQYMPKHLRDKISPHYRFWHYENVHKRFVTDGEKVCYDNDYIEEYLQR